MRSHSLPWVICLCSLLSPVVQAETTLVKTPEMEVISGTEIGAFYGKARGINFGLGIVDARTRDIRNQKATTIEGYLKPSLAGTFDLGTGRLFARTSAVATLSRGDGDLGGGTLGIEEDLDLEEAVVGWRSGDVFALLGKDAIELSLGAQDFKIGDGFLVYDGNTDAFGDAAAWLLPRNAFRQSAAARLETDTMKGDLFYLKADKEHDSAALWGLNAEYHGLKNVSVGAMYLHVMRAIDDLNVRDGLKTADIRFEFKNAAGKPGLSLKGEYARQFGRGRTVDYDADGWHLTGRYDFKLGPWDAFARLRYARFSGDDPKTADREVFDPLFVGYSDYGDWYQGELMSQQALVNANQRTQMLHIGIWPREWLRLDAMYWRFDLDQKRFNGVDTQDRDFADEINLSTEIFLSETSSVGALASIAFPGDAARQSLANNKAYWALEFYAIYNF